MKIFRLLFRSVRSIKAIVVLLLVYFIFSVVYFHIPWSVRKSVYVKVPQLDRAIMGTGFKIMSGWDELGLIGRDAKVPLLGSFRGDKAYAGYPSQGFRLMGRVDVLESRGYVSGYSDALKNPLWVSYRIFDVPNLESGKRPGYRTDDRTGAKVNRNDYTHSGYDRGHMAPNYGIATRYGEEGQRETFLMSNIIPQDPSVNRGIWREIEMRVAKKYGRYFTEVWVLTGPVFQEPVRKMTSGVPIPSHYYKIIVDEHDGHIRTLAFLIEADCPPWVRIKKRLVSIDDIEHRTGLDFFTSMGTEMQDELEAEPATRLWPWLKPAVNYHLKNRTY